MMSPEILPSFLRPLAPSDVPSTVDIRTDDVNVQVVGTEGAEVSRSNLTTKSIQNIRLYGQLASNWCWAAVTQSIILYFDGVTQSQDEIATRHIRWDDNIVCAPVGEHRMNSGQCVSVGNCTGHCNNAHRVRVVLDELNHYDETISTDSPPTFDQLRQQIELNRPVVCRIAWSTGGGHFILVTGWTVDANGVERVHVLDPKRNEGGSIIAVRIMDYVEFSQKYVLSSASGAVNFSYGVK